MFNHNGSIVVPALYDALTKVRNGMILGLKDAKKEDKKHSDEGIHHLWIGGTRVLLNSDNEVLAENIEVESPFDFYSLKVTPQPSEDKNRVSFKGPNGNYYSFIDFQEEFKSWLSGTFLPNIRNGNYESVLFEQIIFETPKLKGKISIEDVFSKHNKTFQRLLFAPFDYDYDYSFGIEDLNYFIYDDSKYEKFLNNCGEPDLWLYPEMVFRAESRSDKSRYLLHFIRVGCGDYKLSYCYQD